MRRWGENPRRPRYWRRQEVVDDSKPTPGWHKGGERAEVPRVFSPPPHRGHYESRNEEEFKKLWIIEQRAQASGQKVVSSIAAKAAGDSGDHLLSLATHSSSVMPSPVNVAIPEKVFLPLTPVR